MTCKACQSRVKGWEGDDPKCGFLTEHFNGDYNWNCATVSGIRDICEMEGDRRIYHHCPENQHYATISTFDLDLVPREGSDGFLQAQPVCLWVGWYKNRGRTEAMWLMFENEPPRQPTEEECLKIIKHYSKT